MPGSRCYVYIVSNAARTVLYIGIASNLYRRIWQHRTGLIEGFTKKYRVNRLLYCEAFPDTKSAALRERQLKGWSRKRKHELIRSKNPAFRDLFPLMQM
ncbi:MAG: GIY-YIG nuclease family protein [bacterium]|nr:GIY-YIG nuclease family protein [bacterium]